MKYENILQHIKDKIVYENEKLNYIYTLITQKPLTVLEKHKLNINHFYSTLLQLKNNIIHQEKSNLHNFDQLIELSRPEKIMKRGFVLVKNGDHFITNLSEVKNIDNAEIVFQDGNRKIKFL